MNKFFSLENRLQKVHRGYAYELLQLQMAVEDQKISGQPSITQITRLIQLYMIGVQVLQSISDSRFIYFHNKIHSLMLKKHIVKKLHEASGKSKETAQRQTGIGSAANKAELKDKKDQYQVNFYFNQGQIDIKKVKQMLNIAQTKKIQIQGKIKDNLKKQQDRLDQRIKLRKLRSQQGSVKGSSRKLDLQETPSPVHKRQTMKEARVQYFNLNLNDGKDPLAKNKIGRTNSGLFDNIVTDKKYGNKNNGSNTERKNEKQSNEYDAI